MLARGRGRRRIGRRRQRWRRCCGWRRQRHDGLAAAALTVPMFGKEQQGPAAGAGAKRARRSRQAGAPRLPRSPIAARLPWPPPPDRPPSCRSLLDELSCRWTLGGTGRAGAGGGGGWPSRWSSRCAWSAHGAARRSSAMRSCRAAACCGRTWRRVNRPPGHPRLESNASPRSSSRRGGGNLGAGPGARQPAAVAAGRRPHRCQRSARGTGINQAASKGRREQGRNPREVAAAGACRLLPGTPSSCSLALAAGCALSGPSTAYQTAKTS